MSTGTGTGTAGVRSFVLVTGNAAKLREARRILGHQVTAVDVDLPEVQSLDLATVLSAKADAAREHTSGPFIVEETGFELAALNGFPGPLVKWMLAAIGAEGIARLALAAGDVRATARCRLLYRDGERELSAEGLCTGELVLPARGERGFGWDSVFQPAGETLTFGELSDDDKDRIGSRGRAWRGLLARMA